MNEIKDKTDNIKKGILEIKSALRDIRKEIIKKNKKIKMLYIFYFFILTLIIFLSHSDQIKIDNLQQSLDTVFILGNEYGLVNDEYEQFI